MTSFLNKTYTDVPCILKSYGKYGRSFERLTLRYKCAHSHQGVNDCYRLYKVFQIQGNEFDLYRNDKDVTHNAETKIVGHVRGEHRKEVTAKIGEMGVEEYVAECSRNADPELLRQGNLQDTISLSAAEKMKSEYLQSLDFDKDDIIDLLLLKIHQDFSVKDPNEFGISGYIRRIGLIPFFVTMFSDEQLRIVKMLETFFSVYVDATGSVVKSGEKKIFYYAGVTPDTSLELNPKERHKVLPLFECISNAHDGFNIGVLLSEFKTEFHKMFPTMPWPIKHAVTDFSYALLNAICWSWNQKKLIDYINCIYDSLKSKTPWPELLSQQVPNMDSEQQSILKEIFAGMFDVKELQTLEKIWINLSKILLSKYADAEVEASLKEPCEIMVPEDQLLQNHENHEQDEEIAQYFSKEEIPLTVDHKPAYQNSGFYQHFKNIMSTESFEKKDAQINSFYSPIFANMLLQKYISILPLWTCFERKANSLVEGHFKDTKKTMIAKQNKYGAPSLKPGRFIRLTEGRVTTVIHSMQQQLPRYRNTGQKRKAKGSDIVPVTKKAKTSDMDQLKSYVTSDNDAISSIVPKSMQISDLYDQFRSKSRTKKRTPSPSTNQLLRVHQLISVLKVHQLSDALQIDHLAQVHLHSMLSISITYMLKSNGTGNQKRNFLISIRCHLQGCRNLQQRLRNFWRKRRRRLHKEVVTLKSYQMAS